MTTQTYTYQDGKVHSVKCNSRKGGRTPAQAHMQLIRAPKRPRRNHIWGWKQLP